MKRILPVMFLVLTLIAIYPLIAPAQESVSVFVNGLAVKSDVLPIIQNGRTLIPSQAIAEAMDIDISWDNQTRTVNATDGVTTVCLQIDNCTAYHNNNSVILDVAPQIVNGYSLIPLRFFAEAFNYQVNWDSTSHRVSILSPIMKPAGSPPPLPVTSQGKYVGDKDSHKFHLPDCINAKEIEWAKEIWFKSEIEAEEAGFMACGLCISAR